MNKLNQERATVQAMIRIYCKDQHPEETLCGSCAELAAYADQRLDMCPFGEGKPTCQNCPIHCYQKVQRERIKEVMRYAGPRMIWHHPVMAIRHLIQSRKPAHGIQPNRSRTN